VELKSFSFERAESAQKLKNLIEDDNLNISSRAWGILKHSAYYLYASWRQYHPLNLFGAKRDISDVYVCSYQYTFDS